MATKWRQRYFSKHLAWGAMRKLLINTVSMLTLTAVSLSAAATSLQKMTNDEIFNSFTKSQNEPRKEIKGVVLTCHAMEVRKAPPFGSIEEYVRDTIIVDTPKVFGLYIGDQEFTSPALMFDSESSARIAETNDAIYSNGKNTHYGNAYAISTKLKTVILYKCEPRK